MTIDQHLRHIIQKIKSQRRMLRGHQNDFIERVDKLIYHAFRLSNYCRQH